jgi:hypothetical protein
MPHRPAFSRRAFLHAAAALSAPLPLDALPGAAEASETPESPASPESAERPLRYRPDGTDFVIENGAESFNRPLYSGLHTAFRVDAGDRPEFSLYVPGRGGVLRLGVRTADGAARWLFDAAEVTARYRPGSMVYTVRDPALIGGVLTVTALPMSVAEGLVLRIDLVGAAEPVELVWGYGGADGVRGSRGGDIGAEREPVRQFFRLTPERCRGGTFTLAAGEATLESRAGMLRCVMPPDARAALGDAARWDDPVRLLESAGYAGDAPLLVGRADLRAGAPLFLALQMVADRRRDGTLNAPGKLLTYADLPGAWERAERRRQAALSRFAVDTPDPFINAAAAALCIAADGVWDDGAGVYLHGAVAWRSPLAGWRGQYAGDAQGRHERTRRHLRRFAAQQNTEPVPARTPGPDVRANLSRSEDALHSSGNLTSNHYDMNLVCIDALFRHLLWTGDTEFAAEMWPVLERHHAWERRLFRRPYGTGPDTFPLYEAYACIWASDDLQYHGGGVTHASAYNLWHNRMTARVARRIGKDAAPAEQEAEQIGKAMRRELWLADRGWFAEWRDLLGRKAAHGDAALWTFYHTLDSEAADPFEAWQMARFVETHIPHIAVRGPGVPRENLYTLPTTRWMPYTWSTNNVVMAESAHTALAFWQAGRADAAFGLWKGCLLDSMFLGLCPGNAGMTTFFDHARGEAQRDFADAVGTNSRALVEGLFGVHPDALSGDLRLAPGFPEAWDHARLRHPDLTFSFRRAGLADTYAIESRFPRPMTVRLCVPAPRDRVRSVIVNGRPGDWRALPDAVGRPTIEVTVPPAAGSATVAVTITWEGRVPAVRGDAPVAAAGAPLKIEVGAARLDSIADPQGALGTLHISGHAFEGTALGTHGHRTVFAHVRQGAMTWWLPVPFEIRPPFEVLPASGGDGRAFRLRNNAAKTLRGPVTIRVGGKQTERRLRAPRLGESPVCAGPASGLLPGSATVVITAGGVDIASGIVTDWTRTAPAATRW